MIIKNKTSDIVEIHGESAVKKATISENKLSKLQYILTKGLYTDPISAVIVEITNNGIDGVVQAKKSPIENPVLVEIGNNKNGGYFFRVTDTGIGLNRDSFENVLMCYLESSKENDADSIGFFGLGSKSFLALDRAATFICRKDGKEYKYLAYQGESFCEYDLLYEKDTKEGNGVIFEMEIKDRWEKADFIAKALNKLSYYDTAVLIIDGQVQENKIYRQEKFQWSDNCTETEMHLCLKDVLYTIDWNKLGISRLTLPVGLRFGLSDGILVTPSREGVILTEEVKKIIKERIAEVSDWFVQKYNENITEFEDFPAAFKHLGDNRRFIELEGQTFYVDELEKYSSQTLEGIKVKGLEHPRDYYVNLDQRMNNFSVISYLNWKGVYNTKHIYANFKSVMSYNNKMILLDQHPVGRVKNFLKEKCGRDTYFLLEKKTTLNDYKSMLRLDNVDKSLWREKIKEVQEFHRQMREKAMTSMFNIRESAEFLKYEAEQKALVKAGNIIDSTYKVLDKQEGEVTIAYARKPLLGDAPVFEKETYVIENIKNNSYISLIFEEADKEEAKNYFGLHKNLKVAIVGKRERTKLPGIHQIMNKKEFEKTKLFKRIVTAIRINDLLDKWNTISGHDDSIVADCLEKVKELKEELKDYRNENFTRLNLGTDAKESFLLVAKEHNLWDNEILYKVKQLEKALEAFYFLQYIEYPRYATEEEKKAVRKIINQLFLYQKKHNYLENYELVPVAQLEEQREVEEEFLNTPEAEECLA